MSLTEDVRKLMSPTDEDGKLNVLYADSYYRIDLEQRYVKEAVDRECSRLKQLDEVGTVCCLNDSQPNKRSDKKEVEALKSRVRRLEKDVKWLKKVVREITGIGNE